jgi:inorganic pyrophosphatase
MSESKQKKHLFVAHPWHGVSLGKAAPQIVTAFIEIVPTDGIKYELDKDSGLLRVDRPQRYSSLCPTLYGFVPQTYCGTRVGARCGTRTGAQGIFGDRDPLDICVLTERAISTGGFLASVRPIGGLRLLDGNEADDKVIAVLEGDLTYGHLSQLEEAPFALIDRLEHYFLSYKQLPGQSPRRIHIAERYDAEEARTVVALSHEDYLETFGDLGG